MLVYLNGELVPEEKAVVSVFDRGFLFGDGLFEAMLITRGRPFRWRQHSARFEHGLKILKIAPPVAPAALLESALALIQRNNMPESILRISISRGIAPRGVSPKNAVNPAVVMSLHPLPDIDWSALQRWRVVIASYRLIAGDPFAGFKSANKLIQILARSEADAAGAGEAILLNTRGYLAEGTTSNLFWIHKGAVCTAPMDSGALSGVTRSIVIDLCREKNIPVKQINARPAALGAADGAFLSMSSFGIVEIEALDGVSLPQSPIVEDLWRAHRRGLESEILD